MASFSVDTSVLETAAKKADRAAAGIDATAMDTYFAFLDGVIPGSNTAGAENEIAHRVALLNKRVADAARDYGTHLRTTKTNYEEAEKANIAPWTGAGSP